MMNKIKTNISLVVLILVFSLVFVSAAYSQTYNPQTSQFSNTRVQGSVDGFDPQMCQAGQDFLLQIAPFGCSPAVVRSDLLEDQDAWIYCQISGTKINPLIEVEAIDHISLRGEYPQEIRGIGYMPARAALGQYDAQINSPLLNNLGYAIIKLKRQPNESAMPDFVEGNLTATINYDIEDAFGVGRAAYYLPVLDQGEWENQKEKYSFWEGRGYLRAESVNEDGARISIYSGARSGFTGDVINRITSVNLREGEESGLIYMPGFNYCMGGMHLELEDVENPDTRASLRINGNYFEYQDGEEFLDNRCKVRDIERHGLLQETNILCNQDQGIFGGDFSLIINPEIEISIAGESENFQIGDKLYTDGDKSVYLAHARSKDEFNITKKNLQVVLVSLPGTQERLSTEQIKDLNRQISWMSPDQISNIADLFTSALKVYSAAGERGLRSLGGQNIKSVSYDNPRDVFGKNIRIMGFSGAYNAPLEEDTQENYEEAMSDYTEIIEAFAQERYPSESQITLGEEAFREAISLSEQLQQNENILGLCADFEEALPEENTPSICGDFYKISNQESAVRDVEINGEVYRISFEGIREPDFEEYGAEISIRLPDGSLESVDLRKEQIIYLDEEGTEYIQLVGLEEDRARLEVNLNISTLETVKQFTLESGTKTLREGTPEDFGSQYIFTLRNVNLDQVAKVSVNPEIRNAQTHAEFPFKIGIEKRSIQLTPEQTRDKIESLNNTLETLQNIQNGLGTVVRAGKAACTVTGLGLTVKNFFSNLGGDGIARQKVMRGEGGWYERCQEMVNADQYGSVDECLAQNNDQIESAVDSYSQEISEENERMDDLQSSFTQSGLFGEGVVDTEKVFSEYVDDSYRDNLVNRIERNIGTTIDVHGEEVSVSNIIAELDSDNTLLSEARDLNVNTRLLDSTDPVVKSVAEKDVKSELIEIWVNSEAEFEERNFAEKYGFEESIISTSNERDYAIEDVKRFHEVKANFLTPPLNDSSFVYPFKDGLNGKEYILVLNNNYRVVNTYEITSQGGLIPQEGANPFNINLRRFSEDTYNNNYENPEIRYYESGRYEGLPAIVPFDVEEGWYAATKPVLPTGRTIEPFEESGRVSSFYLCNVGENGREEFSSGTGDDICQMMNLGTNQPYNQFPGLEEDEASLLVNKAIQAIEIASRRYSEDRQRISLFGQSIRVGNAYVGTPDLKCQDFMSPNDCTLLFNVCDPVVCPSSRCDLGGEYPVEDVVQSGIIGSSLLCLPNFGDPQEGGVAVPVCLTGLHAGVESLSTMVDSYQQCLQTSLETGQTVGICDEIRSVYMCDLLWKEAAPLGEIALREGAEYLAGQGSSGGGEYLTIQDSFDRAGESADYLTDYYAADSFEAFKARSVESAGTEICQSWVSGAYPDMGSLFDALTEPDSPTQFYGSFDEVEYTSSTNPPISQYKVFYHIFSGKDSKSNYEVYLKGTQSYFADTNFKRVVATGFLEVGQYITETKDFTAPSGYSEMCIIVNGQEECGFQRVSTSLATDIINDQYIQDQVSRTDIDSEEECVSGTPDLRSFANLNVQQGAENFVDPQLYDRGITRVCATDNPGKGSDPQFGTEDARWKEVGNCGQENLRCWLDSESVREVIESTRVEEQVLSEHEENTLNALKEEGDYISNFEGFVDQLESMSTIEVINAVTENLDNVFLNAEKAYLLLQRGEAYSKIASEERQEDLRRGDGQASAALDAEREGAGENEEGETSETGEEDTDTGEITDLSCDKTSDGASCQKVVGNEIIRIAQEFKEGKEETQNSVVFQDTGAESFECLALQIAYTESRLNHCENAVSQGFDGNPLYCQNLPQEVYCSPGEENSCGVMQINLDVHGDAIGNYGDFENNVEYGLNLLLGGYDESAKVYRCDEQTSGDFVSTLYSGWERAIRSYNGWNSRCIDSEGNIIGNPGYVEDVIGFKDEVQELFPETCA